MLRFYSVLPLAAFAVTIVATKQPWRVGAVLILGAPFLAASLTIIVGTLLASDIGPVGSARDWISYILTAFVFTFPDAVYPRSTWTGILSLLAWETCKRFTSLTSMSRIHRILCGAGSGLMVGALVALCVFSLYQTPLADLANTSGFMNRFRPPPLFLPMALLTGTIDGLTLALFRGWSATDGEPER
jgi:hypothetical protein